MLELSLRHARRLLADYRQAGAVALAHGCITAELNHNGADYRTNNQLLYVKDALALEIVEGKQCWEYSGDGVLFRLTAEVSDGQNVDPRQL